MAYRIETEGIKELLKTLKALGDDATYVSSYALWEGARVVADEINAQAQTIRTAPFHYAAVEGATKRLPSPEEKAIVTAADAMGIARFRKRVGAVDTSVGYNGSGYADVNWNHMSSKARTNYKAFSFKGRDTTASSTLKWIRDQGGSEKYGLSPTIGRHAQNRKPIGVIANAINSGTSFMDKQPFVRRAVARATAPAEQAIIRKAESMITELINSEYGGKSA